MSPGEDRQGHRIPDSLVESAVGSVAEDGGLAGIGHEVLYVTHLVVDDLQVIHGHLTAHLDPVTNQSPGNPWSPHCTS